MDQRLELILLPVGDVDRSLAFYRDVMGWRLDVDHARDEHFRVVQLTPPGSACSVTFGIGVGSRDVVPGSSHGMHLVVADIVAVAAELAARGADVGPVRHMGPAGWVDGPHPERRDHSTFAEVSDPDGNTWVLQERDHAA